MKQIVLIPLFSLFSLVLLAQNILKVSDKKIVHLVCPDKVLYVSCGDDSSVQAEVVNELSNLIRVRALHPFEGQTSLTVVCDGRIYSMDAEFGNCSVLTYQLETLPSEKASPFSGKLMSDFSLKEISDMALSRKARRAVSRAIDKNGIEMEVRNICVRGDALFLVLRITNRTNMPFDAEAFNFWISDRKRHKATNVQEYQLTPDYTRFDIKRVAPGESVKEVFVIEKLSVPDKRVFRIEMVERATGNTGRKLTIQLRNKHLLKAEKI